MATYDLEAYQQLESELIHSIDTKTSILLLSLPGMGLTHLLKSFAEKHHAKKIKYIEKENEPLSDFNILNLGFDQQPQTASSIADQYFAQAKIGQNFALAITNPGFIHSSEFQLSKYHNHLYKTYYLPPLSPKDEKLVISQFGIKLKPDDYLKIYSETGGIVQLTKFVATNYPLNSNPETINNLDRILKPIAQIYLSCQSDQVKDIKSPLLDQFIKKNQQNIITITVNFDLSFSEAGIPSPHRLNKIEKDILEFMLLHQFEINKEQISDLKWGQGKYDSFSDQAIAKTMRRLNDKLSRYQIQTIPKVGYQLTVISYGRRR
ncbi:MAG: helix-turn-helix domain-containing protein [Candidatus Shapirobacteria bacterium]|jgi:hypothetical protein